MLRAFDHICMEKARYKFLIIIIIIILYAWLLAFTKSQVVCLLVVAYLVCQLRDWQATRAKDVINAKSKRETTAHKVAPYSWGLRVLETQGSSAHNKYSLHFVSTHFWVLSRFWKERDYNFVPFEVNRFVNVTVAYHSRVI